METKKLLVGLLVANLLIGVYAYKTASKVHVVDSKATSGVMRILVDKAYELMKLDLDFSSILLQNLLI